MARRKKTYLSQPELQSEAKRLSTKYQRAVVEQYLSANTGWKVTSVQQHYYDSAESSFVVFMYNDGTFCGVLNDGSKHVDTGKISISAALFTIANANYKKMVKAEAETV